MGYKIYITTDGETGTRYGLDGPGIESHADPTGSAV
jgi:hypothetical protein